MGQQLVEEALGVGVRPPHSVEEVEVEGNYQTETVVEASGVGMILTGQDF